VQQALASSIAAAGGRPQRQTRRASQVGATQNTSATANKTPAQRSERKGRPPNSRNATK
jgi:hypothetical protein